jgi:hypothetical protein
MKYQLLLKVKSVINVEIIIVNQDMAWKHGVNTTFFS